MENFNSQLGWDNMFTPASADIHIADTASQRPAPGDEDNMVLAMAYVKKQRWGELYEDEKALKRGTIFPALDLPFEGVGGGFAL